MAVYLQHKKNGPYGKPENLKILIYDCSYGQYGPRPIDFSGSSVLTEVISRPSAARDIQTADTQRGSFSQQKKSHQYPNSKSSRQIYGRFYIDS